MSPNPRPRLLIFVIAYYAEKTLRRVLERIPAAIFDLYDAEVLVVDDASQDRTFEIGQEYATAHPEIRMRTLRNEFNQGYGGNQKVGYAYAISEKFDFVAMVHGDGQYAPEQLPKLVEPLARGEADAVFGSRMMDRFGALKGGMPLYKYAGNKVLTKVQNTLLGSNLSEFHSGYRLYSVATLQRLRFELNSNDFHFDTEIIIQLLNAKARILELPIPTFYGDEVCRVNGMKYAKDVMFATLRNTAHRAGLLYQRKFDPRAEDGPRHPLKLGYASSHSYALESIPSGSKVLEFGVSSQPLAPKLTELGCESTVVDPGAIGPVDPRVRLVKQDLAAPLSLSVSPFDVILLLDVLGHVKSPESFLEEMRHNFEYEPKTLVVAVPNVAFLIPRVMMLLGQFNQGKAGVLDRAHTRHFTFRSLRQLLLDHGMRIEQVRGVPAPFPKVLGDGVLGKAAVRVNQWLIGVSPGLFSYQIFAVAKSTPDTWFLLADNKARSAPVAESVEKAALPRRARSKVGPRGRVKSGARAPKAKK